MDQPLAPKLAGLVSSYSESDVAASIKAEMTAYESRDGNGQLPDVVLENTLLHGRRGATWGTQFRILSGRAFKNLYRDPSLLTAQYAASILLACKH